MHKTRWNSRKQLGSARFADTLDTVKIKLKTKIFCAKNISAFSRPALSVHRHIIYTCTQNNLEKSRPQRVGPFNDKYRKLYYVNEMDIFRNGPLTFSRLVCRKRLKGYTDALPIRLTRIRKLK